MMREYQLEYHKVFLNLSADPRFQADDFTIVVQPHMRDVVPPIDVILFRILLLYC